MIHPRGVFRVFITRDKTKTTLLEGQKVRCESTLADF